MKSKTQHRLIITLALITLLFFFYWAQGSQAQPAAAEFQAVWDRVRASGAYRFNSDVKQTMTPLPTPRNAGRQAKETRLYMEGRADLGQEEMFLNIWSGGGSVMLPESGMQIKVEGHKTYTRQGGQDWQEAQNFTQMMAPGGDMMGYWHAAEHIEQHEPEKRPTALGPILITRFTFDIDGRRFAEYMRSQMEQQENIPPGVKLELAQAYLDMTGQGELWVGQDGLPIRQIFDLQFPVTAEDYQTAAHVSVDFHDFAPVIVSANPVAAVAGSLPGLNPTALPRLLFPLGAALLFLLLLILIVGRGQKKSVYTPLALVIVASMLLTPLLTVTHVAAFHARQQAQQADQEARQAEFEAREQQRAQLDNRDFDPNRDPLQQARAGRDSALAAEPGSSTSNDDPYFDSSCETDPQADYDGDNLTNLEECILGTLPGSADTDQDGLDDGLEVSGVTLLSTGETWYTDPLLMDSNNDSLADGHEWYFDTDGDGVPDDSDGDGTPDIWDDDNDGDGVPDGLDLSPYMNSQDSVVFSGDNPLELTIDDLQADELVKVEFQLSPTNADHLWYSGNVLDWPLNDLQGQIQDADGLTFYDLDNTLTLSPNDNGDMRLVPMLAIEITGSPNNLPDDATLQQFGISVNQTTADTQTAYVPVQVVADNYGEKNVGFYAAMFYEASGQWPEPQKVSLVWLVEVLNDECDTYADNICTGYSNLNHLEIIQIYDDQWFLTGFMVTEEHQAAVDIIFEDPQATETLAANYDEPYYLDSLFGLEYGLDYTFLEGRDCDQYIDNECIGDGQLDMDTQEIYRRFNYATNSSVSATERWGLPNVFTVQRKTYDSIDLGLMDTTVTQTIAILDDNFTSYWSAAQPITPTLMFAYEQVYRGMNLDEIQTGTPNIGLSNSQLQVMLPTAGANPVEVTTMHSLKWTPYAYQSGWMAADIQDYYNELTDDWADAYSSVTDPDEAQTDQTMGQVLYIAVYNGTDSIVQQGNSIYSPAVQKADSSIYVQIAGDIRTIVVKVVSSYYKYGPELQDIAYSINAAGEDATASAVISEFLVQQIWRYLQSASGFAKLALVGTLIFIAAWALTTIYLTNDTSLGWRITAAVSIGALNFIFSVLKPMDSLRKLAVEFTELDEDLNFAEAYLSLSTESTELTGSSSKAGVVGLIISVAITIGVFVYLWGSGHVQPGTIAFNEAVAATIAAIIVAVLFYILSTTIIGSIIVGIIATIDIILLLLGKNWSITGKITEAIAGVIYQYKMFETVDVQAGDLAVDLANPDLGMTTGNTISYTLPVTTTMKGKRGVGSLTSNSMIYQLSEDKLKLSTSSNARKDDWVIIDPYPVGQIVDKVTYSATLRAGVNVPTSLILNSAYALDGQSCWVSFCTTETVKGSSSDELGSAIVFDVLPATLDEFIDYTDWSEGKVVFRDQDGDGLLSASEGGSDPDDTNWDSDGDQLSDAYELTMRARTAEERGYDLDPLRPDSDGDTLPDGEEIHLGTDPGRSDSDDDGIIDPQEVAPGGGWFLEYAPGNFTKVWSSALEADNDGDGMSDLFERTQDTCPDCDPWADAGMPKVYSPAVWNANPVALYIDDNSVDGTVAPGVTLVYTTTTANNLSSSQSLAGELALQPPEAFSGGPLEAVVNIASGNSESLVSELVTNVGTSTSYQFTSTMNLTDLGTTIWNWDEALDTNPSLKFGSGKRPDVSAVSGWVDPYVMVMDEANDSNISAYTVTVDGALKSPSTRYVASTGSTLTAPAVACADNGICLTVFGENWNDGSAGGVFSLRFHGTLNSPSAAVIGGDINTQLDPPALATDGHDFMAAWIATVGDQQTIWLQPVANGGSPVGDPQLLASAAGDLNAVALEWSGDHYVAVWQFGSNLLQAKVDTTGQAVGGQLIGGGSGWPGTDGGFEAPSIAFDPLSQQSLLVFRDIVGGSAQLEARRIVAGSTYSAVVLAADPLLSADGVQTALCADPKNGGWVVAWALPGQNQVHYQAVSQDGSLRGLPQKGTLNSTFGLAMACSSTQPTLDLEFEEDAGATTFADSSGFGNDVSCQSAGDCPLAGVDGRFGKSVRFDGLANFLQVNISQPNGNFTTDFWFRSSSPNATIVHRQNDLKSIYLNNGNICALVKKNVSSQVQNDTLCSSGTSLADGNWHYVAHTAGSGVHSLYVDGALVARSAAISFAGCSGSACSSFTLAGSDSFGVNPYQGDLDVVRFFSRELSSAEIGDAFEAALAIYDLDEIAGATSFADATQNGYGASCTGSTCPTLDVSGVAGTAAQFDGSNNYITVNPSSRDGETRSYTFESSIPAQWDPIKQSSALRKGAAEKYLGPFNNEKVTLDLSNLPTHDSIKVSFDLYVLGPWVGNNTLIGPDKWEWGYDSKKILNTDFSNILETIGYYQSYPAGSFPMSGITLWEHADCSGFSLAVTQNYSTLQGTGLGNNEVGCYTKPTNTVAALFKHEGYDGTVWTVDPGRKEFPTIENNAIDSVAVWPVGNTPGHGGNTADLLVNGYPNKAAIYNITYTIKNHTASSVQFYFKGDIASEEVAKDWGLDNVTITLGSASSSIPLTNSSFTLSAWAQKESGSGPGIILMQGIGQNNQGLHMGFRSENVFTCAFWNDDLNVNLASADDEWHHYACTYDAATNKRVIYRDGVKIGEDTAAADYSGFGATYIGEGFNSDWRFTGKIDEAAVWAEALPADAIAKLYQKVKVEDESTMFAVLLGANGGGSLGLQTLVLRETGTLLGLDSQAQGHTITVDADLPQTTINTPHNGQVVRGQGRPAMQVTGKASDEGSKIAGVEVRVDNGSWTAAVGTEEWNYSLSLTGLSEGAHTFSARATDILGQEGPPVSVNFILDRTPPAVQHENPPLRPLRDADGRWRIRLNGTANDAHAVASVEVLLQGENDLGGQGWQEALLVGTDWSLDYVLPPFDDNGQSNNDPSGNYNIFLKGADGVGNSTLNPTSSGTFQVDAGAPVLQISNPVSTTTVINSAMTFSGGVADSSSIAAAEVNFTPAQQIDALKGAVLHLPFDQNQATEYFPDESGVNNTATCLGTACPAVNLDGRRDRAVLFDGVDDYLQITNAGSLNFSPVQDFTIALWLAADTNQADTSSAQNVILEKWTGAGGYPYALHYLNQSGKIRAGRGDGSNSPSLTSTAAVHDGQFHHVVLVKSGGTLFLYIDGSLQSSTADSTSGTTTNEAALFLGKRQNGSYPFKGAVDELLIYDRALAGYEVADLYDYGFGTWLPAALSGNTWSYDLPEGTNGLEGIFQLNVRAQDVVGNITPLSGQNLWRGEIDTRPPALAFTAVVDSGGPSTRYACTASDLNLEQEPSCQPVAPAALPVFASGDIALTTYDQIEPWYAATFADTTRLYMITAQRAYPGAQDTSMSLRACDLNGRCTTAAANSPSPPGESSKEGKIRQRPADRTAQAFSFDRLGQGIIRPLTNPVLDSKVEGESQTASNRPQAAIEAAPASTRAVAAPPVQNNGPIPAVPDLADSAGRDAAPLADTTPPVVTVNAGIDGRLIGSGMHMLTGTISADGGARRVQVCTPDGQCENWPVRESGRWVAYLPPSGSANPDALLQTLQVYGLDKAGNRSSEPVVVSYWLDTRHPDLEITKLVDYVNEQTAGSILEGLVNDSSGFNVYILATGPNGRTRRFLANRHGTWSLKRPAGLSGAYQISVQAIDEAGNARTAGPFTVTFDFPGIERPAMSYLPVIRGAAAPPTSRSKIYFPAVSMN